MLMAFQRRLDELALDKDRNFEKSVVGRWKGAEMPSGLVEDLKAFVTLLPHIEKRIFALYVCLPETSKVKKLGSYFLTYMYQPDDFLPESETTGLFGYLDDAYIAALFYELIIEEIEVAETFELMATDRELAKKVLRLRRKAKGIIVDEAIKIKQMIGELFDGDESTYATLFRKKIAV